MDNEGTLIDSNNRTILTVKAKDGVARVKKGRKSNCEKGICKFDDLILSLKPGLESTLVLESDSKYILPFNIKIKSRKCKPGESFTE